MTTGTIVITGASSGIGRVAAMQLAERGWEVAVVGRDSQRTGDVAAAVSGTPFVADFDSLAQVRELAAALLERYPRISVLANNAGGLVDRRGITVDGFERTLQHNHLAPFLLTSLLLPRLIESEARVVNTASLVNRFGTIRLDNLAGAGRPYLGGFPAYANAKLATVLFTRELARRTLLTAYSFHPGFVATSFGHDSAAMRWGLSVVASRQISAEQGAQPLVQLASVESLGAASGTYFDGLYPNGKMARSAKYDGLASRLWDTTAHMVGVSQLRA
jgi:NAD(P)-dependent dehydrogenase (short-subunit alcohol dehydrogenase family)